jgi:hypothetical protein
MHPLVRNLYKRAILVGHDYPAGLDYVRSAWKKALRDPKNCPSCYSAGGGMQLNNRDCHEELLIGVNRGRNMVKEMIGVIQLKKYRAMKQRYNSGKDNSVQEAMQRLEEQQAI